MPTQSEYNQFRRLVGELDPALFADALIKSYFDDACRELTSDFTDSSGVSAPVTDFDTLVTQYHPEVILYAAINYWWQQVALMQDKHSQSLSGTMTQQVGEKWDRAMQMVDKLQTRYDTIQQLGTDITMGHLSRFSKATLTRLGGQSEEDALDGL